MVCNSRLRSKLVGVAFDSIYSLLSYSQSKMADNKALLFYVNGKRIEVFVCQSQVTAYHRKLHHDAKKGGARTSFIVKMIYKYAIMTSYYQT